jgi:hypothetical protein
MEAAFAVGRYVELHPTIPSSFGGSIDGRTRGIVREVDPTHPDDDSCLVASLRSEKLAGEMAWLRAIDLFPA